MDKMRVNVTIKVDGVHLYGAVDYVNDMEDVHLLYKYIDLWMKELRKKKSLDEKMIEEEAFCE